MSLFDIKDQVVVITGGTGVLGRAIGSHLAREGAKVVLLGRRKDVGEELAEDIRKQGGHATFMVCDVTDIEAVNQVRDEVVRLYGRVDALLNAAGGNMPGATIPPGKTLFDVQVEEFQRVLNVNLTGTLIPTQAFLKPMTEAGHGSIVNFSSMAAFRPLSRVMGYAAAKAGISNLTAFLPQDSSSPTRTARCSPHPTVNSPSEATTSSVRLPSSASASPKSCAAQYSTSSAKRQPSSQAQWLWWTEDSMSLPSDYSYHKTRERCTHT